jgi:hypothetical protein
VIAALQAAVVRHGAERERRAPVGALVQQGMPLAVVATEEDDLLPGDLDGLWILRQLNERQRRGPLPVEQRKE